MRPSSREAEHLKKRILLAKSGLGCRDNRVEKYRRLKREDAGEDSTIEMVKCWKLYFVQESELSMYDTEWSQ